MSTSVANLGTDLTNQDPLLGDLQFNGGNSLTETHYPDSTSPVINTGVCSDISGNAITTDQRGYTRDANCDIGSVEYDATS